MSYFVQGYEIVDEFITQNQLNLLATDIKSNKTSLKTGGIRNAEKKYSSIYNLAKSNHIIDCASRYLKKPSKLIRAILFNKTETNNWLVGWHQDRTVSVLKSLMPKVGVHGVLKTVWRMSNHQSTY